MTIRSIHILAGFVVMIMSLLSNATPSRAAENVTVSILTDRDAGAPAAHGANKIAFALRARGISFEQADSIEAAAGRMLLVCGLPGRAGPAAGVIESLKIDPPHAPEALVIRNTTLRQKPALLLAGADDRGLMYAELDVADRIGWATDVGQPFGEVRDTSESPAAPHRAISIYTMNRAYFESRMYNPAYWERYLDTLARNRFNSFVLIFGYENGGFLAPPYPYFFDVEGFDDVRMVGITPEQQRKNLDALNRLIDMAHARGIDVTIGIWDHIYRGGVQSNATPGTEDALSKPTPGLVWGVNADNLMPYTKAALSKFLKLVPRVDAIQFRMHDESGLKEGEQGAFWRDVFRMLKVQAPKLRVDVRAKGLPDSTIEDGLAAGLNLRVTTKFWMEQMGPPFHPTHVNPQNQQDRRHSYADMLRYPQPYKMHWRLWNGGTSRVLLWADPEYARRFVESTHLYDGDGFEVNEPLCTKMQAQAHDARPFELLKPERRYTDYEFERYWHFFQVFGRIGYNPNTPAEVWDHEFARRFGADAGAHVARALHRASQVLPRIVAACYPYRAFPMTRGWCEKQPLGTLAQYAAAETSDVSQFASFDEEAQVLLGELETAKVRPPQTSRWFHRVAQEITDETNQAKRGTSSRELASTCDDLMLLANLAEFHARRIRAAVAYCLFKRTGRRDGLAGAVEYERRAIDSWKQLSACGEQYSDDLMMGSRGKDLCGHWRDEIPVLEKGLGELDQQLREAPATQPSDARLADDFENEPALPTILHEPITRLAAGQPLTIRAQVKSDRGIKWVRLRCRAVNQKLDYETIPMSATGRPDEYQTTVSADRLRSQWDFMYYIEALDTSGHGRNFPDLESQTPYLVVRLQR
jgi:hypothetical protein